MRETESINSRFFFFFLFSIFIFISILLCFSRKWVLVCDTFLVLYIKFHSDIPRIVGYPQFLFWSFLSWGYVKSTEFNLRLTRPRARFFIFFFFFIFLSCAHFVLVVYERRSFLKNVIHNVDNMTCITHNSISFWLLVWVYSITCLYTFTWDSAKVKNKVHERVYVYIYI